MWKQTVSWFSLTWFSILFLLSFVLAACGPEAQVPQGPAPGYITAVFQECREQEALGDASACWKLFTERFGTSAAPAELEYAKLKTTAKPAPVEPQCSAGTAYNGTECVSTCKEASLETWDNGENACIRKVELECNAYFHQEDGHCVADPSCPAGMRKVAVAGCEKIPPSEKSGLKPGMPVVSLVDQTNGTKVMVKRGAKGTYWYTDPADDLVFVLWDDLVGATPVYPGPATGVPQGKQAHGYWVGADEIASSIDDATLIPQWCGQRAGQLSFGRVKVGTMVRLGKHRPVDGDANWDPAMEQYVGKISRVTDVRTLADSAGCPLVKVGADNGKFVWRVRDLSLAPVARNPAPAPAAPTAPVKADPPK